MQTKELKPVCSTCSSILIYEDGRLCYNCKHLPKNQNHPWITNIRTLNNELKANYELQTREKDNNQETQQNAR